MKLTFLLLAALAFAFGQGQAQTQTHMVTLAWTDTANPSGTTYNVFRSTGNCPAAPPTLTTLGTFAQINAAAVTAKLYLDTTVTGSTTYCYFVTAFNSTGSSAPSAMIPSAVPGLFVPIVTITVAQ